MMTKLKTILGSMLLLGALTMQPLTAADGDLLLAHDVYFTLKDDSKAAQMRLVKACQKYLSDHPGTVWFDAAVPVKEHDREVNDREFDVALHLLFKNKAAHDAYQKAAKHHTFIEENQANWEKVRVFDSWVLVSSHSQAKPAEHGEDTDSTDHADHAGHAEHSEHH
jgi:hypothetical protein